MVAHDADLFQRAAGVCRQFLRSYFALRLVDGLPAALGTDRRPRLVAGNPGRTAWDAVSSERAFLRGEHRFSSRVTAACGDTTRRPLGGDASFPQGRHACVAGIPNGFLTGVVKDPKAHFIRQVGVTQLCGGIGHSKRTAGAGQPNAWLSTPNLIHRWDAKIQNCTERQSSESHPRCQAAVPRPAQPVLRHVDDVIPSSLPPRAKTS